MSIRFQRLTLPKHPHVQLCVTRRLVLQQHKPSRAFREVSSIDLQRALARGHKVPLSRVQRLALPLIARRPIETQRFSGAWFHSPHFGVMLLARRDMYQGDHCAFARSAWYAIADTPLLRFAQPMAVLEQSAQHFVYSYPLSQHLAEISPEPEHYAVRRPLHRVGWPAITQAFAKRGGHHAERCREALSDYVPAVLSVTADTKLWSMSVMVDRVMYYGLTDHERGPVYLFHRELRPAYVMYRDPRHRNPIHKWRLAHCGPLRAQEASIQSLFHPDDRSIFPGD